MKEERMKILKMLEDGKITAEEASKLFESLRDSFAFEDYEESDFNDKLRRFGKDAESFLKNIGGRMGGFVKDMEPRVRNVTKTVVAKTAGVVDELSKALGEILDSMGGVCAGPEAGKECGCDARAKDERKEEASPSPEDGREN